MIVDLKQWIISQGRIRTRRDRNGKMAVAGMDLQGVKESGDRGFGASSIFAKMDSREGLGIDVLLDIAKEEGIVHQAVDLNEFVEMIEDRLAKGKQDEDDPWSHDPDEQDCLLTEVTVKKPMRLRRDYGKMIDILSEKGFLEKGGAR